MADDTIRVGFVGAGGNTRLRHLPGLQAIDGVEAVSVSNRSRESSQRVAGDFGIPTIYDSWVDLIEAPDTDAICIGTWPYMHSTLTIDALENGKHVLCEARMAMSASEAHAMLDASHANPGLVAQIVPAPHTLKVDNKIKELIADGYLGDIMAVDMSVDQGGFVDYDAPVHWRHNRDLSGYNIMHMGIWYEAMMRWIGPASSVTAVSKVNVKSRLDGSGARRHITIPDQVEILAEMESGPITRMRVSTVLGFSPADSVWLFGTEGTLQLDGGSMTLRGGRRGDSEMSEIEIPEEQQGGWRVEEEFVNAIRGVEEVTHTSFEDGVRYMEFSEAVTRSAQSGMKVELPL
jgi:predicted dehydrogenase